MALSETAPFSPAPELTAFTTAKSADRARVGHPAGGDLPAPGIDLPAERGHPEHGHGNPAGRVHPAPGVGSAPEPGDSAPTGLPQPADPAGGAVQAGGGLRAGLGGPGAAGKGHAAPANRAAAALGAPPIQSGLSAGPGILALGEGKPAAATAPEAAAGAWPADETPRSGPLAGSESAGPGQHGPGRPLPARPRQGHPRRRTERLLWGLSLPVLLAGLWELGSRLGWVPAHALPAPSAVFAYLADSGVKGPLWAHLAATLARLGLGFALGLGLALPLGLATGLSRRTRWALDPLLQALRSIPSLAWVPLFLIWLGIGEPSKFALIALGAFFPIYLNLTAGLAGVDRKLIEVGRIQGLNPLELVGAIHLPAALPALWTGLRSGLGLAWMFVVAAEILGASQGLGFLLEYGRNVARPEIILASIVLFASLGKLSDGLLAAWEARALAWRDTERRA